MDFQLYLYWADYSTGNHYNTVDIHILSSDTHTAIWYNTAGDAYIVRVDGNSSLLS